MSINQFYDKKSVLVTGGTGLVGKVLLYKILDSIDSIENIYVLLRKKGNKCFGQRFDDLIKKSNGLFDGISDKVLSKLVPIEGDLTTHGMGLNESDRKLLIDKVSIVFHSAADVSFDTNLKKQMLINVGGLKEITELCRSLKQFDVLVFVSTAYSNPLQMVVNEKVYDSDLNPIELLDIARNSKNPMKAIEYIGEFPNTYTFTKNLAELLVNNEFKKGDFPATIVRPGVVSGSYREPVCGWFPSITSIAGLFIMAVIGFARRLKIKRNIKFDAIPVDIVANACIIAAFRFAQRKQDDKAITVYNCNSTCLGSKTFGESFDNIFRLTHKHPCISTIRPPVNVISDCYWLPLYLTQFFAETCFAYLLDLVLLIIGKRRIAVKRMKTYHAMNDAIQPFIDRQWYFTNDNMISLSQELSGEDKEKFNCDIKSIDWDHYLEQTYHSNKRTLLKESKEDADKAIKSIVYLRNSYTIVNYLLLYVLWYVLISFTPFESVVSLGLARVINGIKTITPLNFGFFILSASAIITCINQSKILKLKV